MAGSIAKRQDGRWRARYRDEAGNERARHFERKVDAQRWLDEIASSVLSGTYVDPKAGKVTFKQFYEDWSQRQLCVPSTQANAELATRSTTFAALPMKAIRRSQVEAWVKVMSTRRAPSTIKTRFVMVRSVFRAAVADRVIAFGPSAGVALPRRRKAEAAMRTPRSRRSGDCSPTPTAPGCPPARGSARTSPSAPSSASARARRRPSRSADIDFLRRQLTVSRQLQRDGSGYVVRPPKYGSERVVYLPDELVTILSEHVAAFTPDGDQSRWLFTVGEDPLYDDAITWRWRATRQSAGLPDVRLHDLRHLFASGLIAAGCDVVTVQRRLATRRRPQLSTPTAISGRPPRTARELRPEV